MRAYKEEFIDLAIEVGALQFGEFSLKSGRVSPYFFNAGLFNTGYAAARLGRCYAAAVADIDAQFDMLFGPAYKGIPLVTLTAAALAANEDLDYPFCFNRKEAKDHGEGGNIIGAPLQGNVLILDDVITAGTAVRESIQIIRNAGANPSAVFVAIDREEVGVKERISAVQQAQRDYGISIHSLITLSDLIEHLEDQKEFDEQLPKIRAYRNRYGTHFENYG